MADLGPRVEQGGIVTKDQVIAALRTVIDPELRRDIVSLEMIRGVTVEGRSVRFTLELTTPACPVREQMEREARQAVLELPGVDEVTVDVQARVRSPRHPQGPIPGVKNVIAVGSGKGGVGKSTVSVNLAVALAQSGAAVGLLDADITGPNVPLMMGAIGAQVEKIGATVKPVVRHGVRLISIGLFGRSAAPVIWRGPMVGQAIQQFLRDVDWGELDYLIVDLPPGTGDAPLSLTQSLPLSGGVIVTTPQDVSLLDATKALLMFRKLSVTVHGIVENMSYFVCPHCHGETDIFGRDGGARMSAEFDVPFLGAVPLDPAVRRGGDDGTPIVVSQPDSPHAAAFRTIAQRLAGRVSVAAVSIG